MFVYQNKDHDVCITKGNLPVENPEYVIKMDNGMLVCTGDDKELEANLKAAEERAAKAEAAVVDLNKDVAKLNAKVAELEATIEELKKVEE